MKQWSEIKIDNRVKEVEEIKAKREFKYVVNGSILCIYVSIISFEIKEAIWDCDSFKSPGPDDINFGFIKQFWLELKDDFMRFVVEFHRNGKLTKGVNATFISLIPKVDSPQRLNDFRPISLVGCMYKVLAKLLANRLRAVMGSVVSDSQSAFCSGQTDFRWHLGSENVAI